MLEDRIKKLLEERIVKERIDEDWRKNVADVQKEVMDKLFKDRFLEDKIFILNRDNMLLYCSDEPIHPLITKLLQICPYGVIFEKLFQRKDVFSDVGIRMGNKRIEIGLIYRMTEYEFDKMIEILGIKIDIVAVDEHLTKLKEGMKVFEVMKKYTV